MEVGIVPYGTDESPRFDAKKVIFLCVKEGKDVKLRSLLETHTSQNEQLNCIPSDDMRLELKMDTS